MSSSAIKANFHQLIENVEDIDMLQHFYEILYLLHKQTPTNEVTEELNAAQKSRLEASLAQSAKGQTISNEKMKEKIKQWLLR